MKKYIPFFCIALLVVFTFTFPYISGKMTSSGLNGKRLDLESPKFSLIDISDNIFTSAKLKGKWSFLTFGFSKCTGTCPMNLSKLSSVIESIESTDKRVIEDTQFIFISIDPERDNKRSMTSFSSNFSPRITPLLAGKDLGTKVAKEFNAYVLDTPHEVKDEDYQINHAGFFYLIDPNGVIQVIYLDKDISPQKLYEDLIALRSSYGTISI